MFKKTLSVLLTSLCAVMFAGCNTVAGLGKDVEKAGEAVQGAAKKAQ